MRQRQLDKMTVKELKAEVRGTENVLGHYQNPQSGLYNPKAIAVTERELAAAKATLEALLRDRKEVCFNTNYRLHAITTNIVNSYWAENDD